MSDAPLPAGLTVRVRDDVRRMDGAVPGELLVGGTPLRVLRLSATARALLPGDTVTVHDRASAALARLLVDAGVADADVTGVTVPEADLTVVVPVRDRADRLDRALAALAGLTVVVVDDASRDPDAVAAVARARGARLVRLPVNRGPAGARNAGLATVRTPYVAFVDSDVTVSAAALLRLARQLADPRVVLAGPRIAGRATGAGPARWFERYEESASSLSLGLRGCSVRPGAAVAWLPSACLVGRTAALGTGFDDRLRVAEDVDLVWRLVAAGHAVRYDPGETAWHDTRPTVRAWLGRKVDYGTGGAALARRHGRTGAPAVMSWSMAVPAAALLLRRRWSVPVATAGLAVGALRLQRRLPVAPGRDGLALRLAAQGLGWALRQQSALLLRHWWPLTLAASASRPVRRAVLTALVVDAVGTRLAHPERPCAPLARRLDDLAYGAGLWLGALRARSVECLLPRRS